MKEKPSQLISKWLKTGDKTVAIRYMSYFIIALLIFGFCGYAVTKMRLNDANCNNLSKIYTGFQNYHLLILITLPINIYYETTTLKQHTIVVVEVNLKTIGSMFVL